MSRWELNKKGQIFLNTFVDFFLPRFCPSCKNNLNAIEQFVCEKCLAKIKTASSDQLLSEFNRKFAHAKVISAFQSLFVFEKDKEFQSIAHELKYNGKYKLGLYLGKIVALQLRDIIQSWNADLIIPVPLHPVKKAERGYNQAYFIAKGIQTVTKIPIEDKIIRRERFTESQTTMTLVERKENIQNAFTLRKAQKIKEKNIVLVDDVITTGATISECGRLLKDNEATKIFALSVAIAD